MTHFTAELLRAQELGLGVMGVAPPLSTDYADAVYSELQLASNKYEVLKKMEEDLRAEQELVDKSALLMKMLEVSKPNSKKGAVSAAEREIKWEILLINNISNNKKY